MDLPWYCTIVTIIESAAHWDSSPVLSGSRRAKEIEPSAQIQDVHIRHLQLRLKSDLLE